jgi:hypothetical protein
MKSNQDSKIDIAQGWTAPAGRTEASQLSDDLKASAVILTLAEPLLKKHGKYSKRLEGIIVLTVATWNIAMLPEEKQAPAAKEMINKIVPSDGSAEDVAAIIELMDIVEERRKALFPNLRMFVADYSFRASESGMTLNVGAAAIPEIR